MLVIKRRATLKSYLCNLISERTGGTSEVLRLQAVSVGVVVVEGEVTGRYLAMSRQGRLYGSQTLNDECYFLEKYEENHHNTYRSQKYGWYVGLKRNGRPKAGPLAHRGQKAVLFLPRPAGDV
ncbi:putative fibroblast growth factor 1 [Liparis tanakae]|uniref:Fibroblast growth factor n=1 Tax=Liparis tanakae TaxID=230148 RepID=A0A4Z2EVL9_9TELE|nr:putative fibroblast growth factor 1 [Liparis tanakae]